MTAPLTFVAVCERRYPKKLALMMLEELEREFSGAHNQQKIDAAVEPFAFQTFETFMKKTKALYEDQNSQRNVDEMSKVQDELGDVHRILSQNISEIVERGAKIESKCKKSLAFSKIIYVFIVS